MATLKYLDPKTGEFKRLNFQVEGGEGKIIEWVDPPITLSDEELALIKLPTTRIKIYDIIFTYSQLIQQRLYYAATNRNGILNLQFDLNKKTVVMSNIGISTNPSGYSLARRSPSGELLTSPPLLPYAATTLSFVDSQIEALLFDPKKTYLVVNGDVAGQNAYGSNYTVNWGDGHTATQSAALNHEYTDGVKYHLISISGIKTLKKLLNGITAIERIVIGGELESLGTEAVKQNPNLKVIDFSNCTIKKLSDGDMDLSSTKIAELKLPKSLTDISDYAIKFNGLIDEITIPKGVTSGCASFLDDENSPRVIKCISPVVFSHVFVSNSGKKIIYTKEAYKSIKTLLGLEWLNYISGEVDSSDIPDTSNYPRLKDDDEYFNNFKIPVSVTDENYSSTNVQAGMIQLTDGRDIMNFSTLYCDRINRFNSMNPIDILFPSEAGTLALIEKTVPKLKPTYLENHAYTCDSDGNVQLTLLDGQSGQIVRRDKNGEIFVPNEPINEEAAVNLKKVKSLIKENKNDDLKDINAEISKIKTTDDRQWILSENGGGPFKIPVPSDASSDLDYWKGYAFWNLYQHSVQSNRMIEVDIMSFSSEHCTYQELKVLLTTIGTKWRNAWFSVTPLIETCKVIDDIKSWNRVECLEYSWLQPTGSSVLNNNGGVTPQIQAVDTDNGYVVRIQGVCFELDTENTTDIYTGGFHAKIRIYEDAESAWENIGE